MCRTDNAAADMWDHKSDKSDRSAHGNKDRGQERTRQDQNPFDTHGIDSRIPCDILSDQKCIKLARQRKCQNKPHHKHTDRKRHIAPVCSGKRSAQPEGRRLYPS